MANTAESSNQPPSQDPPDGVAPKPAARPVAAQIRKKPSGKRTALRWLKRGIWTGFGLIVVATIVVAWLPKPVAVDSATVARGSLRITVDEDGRSRVKDRYVVSAPITGNLARIELTPGATVTTETIVARIMPLDPPLMDARSRAQAEGRVASATAARRQTEAAIARARAAVEYANRDAERQGSLAGRGLAAQQALERANLEARSRREELTSAEFGARIARYELEMAQAALGRLSNARGTDTEQLDLPAPVAGRILKLIQVSEGAVQVGTPLLEIGDPAALEIVVDVLTSDATQITPGAPVEIDRWGGSELLRGHVRLIEPSAFTRVSALGVEEQRVNVVIDLDEPHERWASLGDGYRVEAHIVIWQAEDVLHVPASAVFRHDGGWAVYVIRDGIAKLNTVEIGRRTGLSTQVTDGLAVGDHVIVHPSDRVVDGIEVVTR